MRVTIFGSDFPGRTVCDADGRVHTNLHVGPQVRREPADLVPADSSTATWELGVDVVAGPAGRDFRGPAVQGRRGERFLYLTWGDVADDGAFEMIMRAKLMLHRVDEAIMNEAVERGELRAQVSLTDAHGGPRCARVDPPAIVWTAP